MTQLDELHAFVRQCLPERLVTTVGSDAWMDNIKLEPAAKDWGLKQRRIAIRSYSASLAWERWPYRQYAPDVLFALVMVWLQEHDQHDPMVSAMIEPDVFVELIDNENATVVITLPLADNILLKEDAEAGTIPLGGKQYRVIEDPRINVAKAAWIHGAGRITGGPTHAG